MTVQSVSEKDWVPTLLALDPELAAPLRRAGIRDERTYLEREGFLSRRIRTEVASTRRDLLLLGRIPLRDLARVSPPWISGMTLSELRVPARVVSECSAVGIVRIADLAGSGEYALPADHALPADVERTVKLALYRAGKRGAPRPKRQSPGPDDRVRGLVRSAPEPIRELALVEISGLPTRVRNTMSIQGVRTVSDLERWSDTDLKLLPQFGEKSLEDLITGIRAAIDNFAVEGCENESASPCP